MSGSTSNKHKETARTKPSTSVCPVCQFVLKNGETHCPKCQQSKQSMAPPARQDAGKTQEHFPSCPVCHFVLKNGESQCPKCQQSKQEIQKGVDPIKEHLYGWANPVVHSLNPTASADIGKTQEPFPSCPVCHFVLKSGEGYCPRCSGEDPIRERIYSPGIPVRTESPFPRNDGVSTGAVQSPRAAKSTVDTEIRDRRHSENHRESGSLGVIGVGCFLLFSFAVSEVFRVHRALSDLRERNLLRERIVDMQTLLLEQGQAQNYSTDRMFWAFIALAALVAIVCCWVLKQKK